MHSGSEGDLSASSARSLEVRLSSMTMSSSTTSLTGSPRRGGLSSLPPPSFRRSSEDDVLHHGRRVGSPHDLRSAARRGYPSPIGRSVSSSDDVHRLGASPSSRRALPPPPVRRRDDDAGSFGDRLALAPRTPDAGAVGSARRSSAVSPSPRDDGPDPLFPGLLDDAVSRPSYEEAPSSPFCTPRKDASLFESSVLPRAVSDGSSATSSLRGPTSRDRSRATRDDGGAHHANGAYAGRDVGLVRRPSASATARHLPPVHSHAHPPDYPSPPDRFGYKSVRPPPHQPPHPHSMLAQPPQPQSQSYPPPPPQNAVGGSGSVRQPPPIRYPHPADYHGLRRPFPPEPQQPPQQQPQQQQQQQPPPVVPYPPERWPVRHRQVSSWPDAPNNYRGPPPPQPGISSSSVGCPPPPPSYPPPPYHHHGCPPQQPPPPHFDDHPLHHPHPDHRRASSGSSLDTASDANPQQGYRFGGSGGGARWPPHDAPRRARPLVVADVLDADASHLYGGGGPVGPPGRRRRDGGDGSERGGNCFDASKGLLPPSPVPGPGAPPKLLPPNPVLPYARSRSSFDLSPPEDHQLHPHHPHAHHPDLLLRSAGKVFHGDNRSRSDHDLRHHPSHHHHQRHPSHHSQHSSHHPSPPASVASSHHSHHSHHHHPPPPSNHHHHHHSHNSSHHSHNSSHHSHNSSHHSHSHRSSSSNHHSSSNTLVYNVKFKRTQRSFVLGPRAPRDVGVGCYVKVEADRGEDLGFVVGRAPKPRAGAGAENDLKRIVRLATHDEVVHLETKRGEEDELLRACRERVDRRRLPMTVRDAEYQFDRNKLTFFFEADGRVDFRELVRDLFSVYKTRIWMQQLDKNGGPDVDAPPPPGEGGEADAPVAAISDGGDAGDRDLVASGATVR